MLEIGKLIEGLKLPTRIIFAIALATGTLLFSRDSFLDALGLKGFVASNRSYIGATFVISACIFIVAFLSALGKFIWPWIAQSYWLFWGKKRLRKLNPEEKGILAYYIHNQTREQNLSITSGAVKVLEMEKIIFRASQLGNLHGFSYAMQPWAWEYLNRHPELLK